MFDHDATVVAQLRDAGAVLVAKLAHGRAGRRHGLRQPNASLHRAGAQPVEPRRAGRAARRAAPARRSRPALVALRHRLARRGARSSRRPRYCGVAGLRPTYGRVSRHGAMALSWTLDKLGPMRPHADDCGLVLDAIAGHDPADPTTVRPPVRLRARDARAGRLPLRGAPQAPPTGAQPEVRANFERLARGAAGDSARVEAVALPDLPYDDITRTILFAPRRPAPSRTSSRAARSAG